VKILVFFSPKIFKFQKSLKLLIQDLKKEVTFYDDDDDNDDDCDDNNDYGNDYGGDDDGDDNDDNVKD
jgi:hypothetical protein